MASLGLRLFSLTSSALDHSATAPPSAYGTLAEVKFQDARAIFEARNFFQDFSIDSLFEQKSVFGRTNFIRFRPIWSKLISMNYRDLKNRKRVQICNALLREFFSALTVSLAMSNTAYTKMLMMKSSAFYCYPVLKVVIGCIPFS